ncbi:Zeaxanthin glucosyl transferase [Lunatimonas lonarensis]|uniref:Zeaxanthin glucosyl transferase n=2 Tax=Lunatimonas lonarensis TaxID=1232681 RepID=R7ZWP7_9BACT|nr:Zeaxanthin glucosyl transferase [Lunatimonas lonarensis]
MVSREILRGFIRELNPDWVYLDDFCATDLLLIWDIVDLNQVRVLSPSFPAHRNTEIPPQQRFSMPGPHAAEEWEKWESEGFEAIISKKVRELVLLLSSDLELPETHSIWNFFGRIPMFAAIEKFYCVPAGFDFPGQKLMPWESYSGWSVRLDREEEIDVAVGFLVKKAKSKPDYRLIYVSLGTVILEFIPKQKLTDFFEKIVSIGRDHPRWYFFVQVPSEIVTEVRPKSINVHIRAFLPQLHLLRHADLMVTHGGTNSIAEARLFDVPILAMPLVDFMSSQGNCARVVYHGLGRAATLDTPTEDLCRIIQEMVEEGAD